MFASLLVSALILIPLTLYLLGPYFVRIVSIRKALLYSSIAVVALVGSYVATFSSFQMLLALVFGIIAFFLRTAELSDGHPAARLHPGAGPRAVSAALAATGQGRPDDLPHQPGQPVLPGADGVVLLFHGDQATPNAGNGLLTHLANPIIATTNAADRWSAASVVRPTARIPGQTR